MGWGGFYTVHSSGHLTIHLVEDFYFILARYGYFLRKPHSKEWADLTQNIDLSWKDTIRPIFQYYTRRTPGTSVEEVTKKKKKEKRITEVLTGNF